MSKNLISYLVLGGLLRMKTLKLSDNFFFKSLLTYPIIGVPSTSALKVAI